MNECITLEFQPNRAYSSLTMQLLSLKYWSTYFWTPDTFGRVRVWGKTMPGSVLLECHSFKSCKLHFQIFNAIGQVLFQFSKFLCSTVYLLPVISKTWMLVGWCGILSLTNTDGSIPVFKTLSGKVFHQTLSRLARRVWGSRLKVSMVQADN